MSDKRKVLIIFAAIILILTIFLLLRSANDSGNDFAGYSVSTQDDLVIVTTEATTESDAEVNHEAYADEDADETNDDSEDVTEDSSEESSEEDVDYTDDDEEEYTFRNEKLLESHYDKHGREMGFDSAEDYEDAASDVVNNPDALHKTEKEDGDDVYYVKKTNEFVIVSRDGYIRTYFNPSDGINYYNRQ